MPQRKNRKSKNQKSQPKQRPVVDASGILQRLGIPVPRLPFLIGSATNLGVRDSVYPNVSFSIPILLNKVSLVAGACAGVVNLDLTQVNAFATRFGALFREYAITGARLEIRIANVVNSAGVVIVFINEKQAGAPIAAEAQDSPHLEALVSSTESPSRHMVSWVPQDLLDLEWTVITTTFTPAYLKVWASVATTGTLAGTTADVLITGALQFGFRGWA